MHRTRTPRRGAVAPAEADARHIDLSSSLEQRLAALFMTPETGPEPARETRAAGESRDERARRRPG
jgi:hypothetical protein